MPWGMNTSFARERRHGQPFRRDCGASPLGHQDLGREQSCPVVRGRAVAAGSADRQVDRPVLAELPRRGEDRGDPHPLSHLWDGVSLCLTPSRGRPQNEALLHTHQRLRCHGSLGGRPNGSERARGPSRPHLRDRPVDGGRRLGVHHVTAVIRTRCGIEVPTRPRTWSSCSAGPPRSARRNGPNVSAAC